MGRNILIDLIRGFSILSIMACHLLPYHSHQQSTLLGQYLISRIGYNGSLGVPAFFVTSGFLITSVFASGKSGLFKPDLREFYSRRIGRIFPLYYLVILIYTVMTFAGLNIDTEPFRMWKQAKIGEASPAFWFSIMTHTFNWFSTFSGVSFWGNHWGILWALSVEVQFYFLYPFLLLFAGNKFHLSLCLLFLIILGIVVHFAFIWYFPEIINYNSFTYFSQIALGCLLYLAFQQLKKFLEKNKRFSTILFFSGLLMALALYAHIPSKPELWWALLQRFLFAVSIFILLLGGFNFDWSKSGIFRVLAWPGRLCYGLYLLHYCVFFIFWNFLTIHGILTDYFFYSTITILAAFISFRYFENPLNQYLRRILNPVRR